MIVEATVKNSVSGIKAINDSDIQKLISEKEEMLKKEIITEKPVEEEMVEEAVEEKETEVEEEPAEEVTVVNKKNTKNKK